MLDQVPNMPFRSDAEYDGDKDGPHHSIELRYGAGPVICGALWQQAGIDRYGCLPMDEALVTVALDLAVASTLISKRFSSRWLAICPVT